MTKKFTLFGFLFSLVFASLVSAYEVTPLKVIRWNSGSEWLTFTRSTGADSVKKDTSDDIYLRTSVDHGRLKEIWLWIEDQRMEDSTKLKKATDSLCLSLLGKDPLGNLVSLRANFFAYDSTKRYVARDSLRDGYLYLSLANDSMLNKNPVYVIKMDSTDFGADSVSDVFSHITAYFVGQGWNEIYESLEIVLKSVAHDSTRTIDSFRLKSKLVYW